MGLLDFNSDEEQFIEISENITFDDFIETDDEKTKNIVYTSIDVVDALEIANDAWSLGAPFDTDTRILKDIVVSDPLRIVQKDVVEIDGQQFYRVWAMATVHGKDYGVPIRFHADMEAFDAVTFEWAVDQSENRVSLQGIIMVMKQGERQRWSSLLDE